VLRYDLRALSERKAFGEWRLPAHHPDDQAVLTVT
jgi:hypothetical protein